MSPVVEQSFLATPKVASSPFAADLSNPFATEEPPNPSANEAQEPGNPFASEAGNPFDEQPGNPFGGGDDGKNPFESDPGDALQGSPFAEEVASDTDVESDTGDHCNPFESVSFRDQPDSFGGGRNPFTGEDGGNPFAGDDGGNPFGDDVEGCSESGGRSPAGSEAPPSHKTFSLGQGSAPTEEIEVARSASAMSSRLVTPRRSPSPSEPPRGSPVPGGSPDARVARATLPPASSPFMMDMSPFAGDVDSDGDDDDSSSHVASPERLRNMASSPDQLHNALEVGTPRAALAGRPPAISPRASPRRLPAAGLAGCVLGGLLAEQSLGTQRPSTVTEAQVQRAFAVDSMEVSLARSDVALHKSRLGPDAGFWGWKWRDYAAEEQHNELQKCSQSLAEILSEDDWSFFAYELMLLVHNWLGERDAAFEHVAAVMPICRVSLRINMALHHRLAELTLPDGSQRYFPFDVRFRAALLLRSWTRVEDACFGIGINSGADAQWTTAWVRRQLAVLRGSVLVRAHTLHRADKHSARSVCASVLQALRQLDELATLGTWGMVPEPGQGSGVDGRRLLVDIMRDLDALRPSAGHWPFHTIIAAKVFSQLWRAATDEEAEDRLSLDAPVVAAALLSGLHPHLGTVPLQLETHGVLLAQQLWLALSSGRCCGATPSAGLALPTKALSVAADVLDDFSQWLQDQELPVNTAAFFARRQAESGNVYGEEAAELVARRLLTVELRDGLVQALTDYRRHLEPEAFSPALLLWKGSQRAAQRSELLVQATPMDGIGSAVAGSSGEGDRTELPDGGRGGEDDNMFMQRMGHWFIFQSVSATARLALQPYDEPVQVPKGDADQWRRLGPRIKKHIDGLTGAVQSLLDELECERSFYGQAWERQGLGADHLGVTAAALSEAARPRVQALVSCGMWPTAGAVVMEIPAGGGRLLRALETLDRLASRWPAPGRRPAEPLVDCLLPHVCAALTEGFTALDRDITSHALEGADSAVFQPLRPPTLLYCDGVVTLWRFVNDALDAPLSLGVPVDIVVQPFLDFLTGVLHRTQSRLLRPGEQKVPFRLAPRAAQVMAELAKNDYEVDDSDDDAGLSGNEGEATRRKKGKKNKFLRWNSTKPQAEGPVTKNVIIEANLLEVDNRVTPSPVHEVSVRLSSLGFCLAELDGVYNKLFKAVNSGDDSDVPTLRHNDARRRICEELPELQDFMRERCGHLLVKYLAQRLVYFELRQDLFERLYFTPESAAGGLGADRPSSAAATPLAGANEFSSVSFLVDAGPASASCLSLEAVLARRQDGLLGLVAQTPAALLVPFVVELGTQLTNAWTFVVLDYLRRAKLDRAASLLDDDMEALKRLVAALMQEARRHVTAKTQTPGGPGSERPSLIGLSVGDCDEGSRRLEDVLRVAQALVLKVHSGTVEELARFAGRVCGEFGAAGGETPAVGSSDMAGQQDRGRSQSNERGSRSPREPEAPKKGGIKIGGIRVGGSTNRGRSASPRGQPEVQRRDSFRSERLVSPSPTPTEDMRQQRTTPATPMASTPHGEGGGHHPSSTSHSRSTWKKAVGKISKPFRGSTPSSARSSKEKGGL